MADIKQAIEYAKQNPDTPFALELRKRIETGKMNTEIQQAGLNLPPSAGGLMSKFQTVENPLKDFKSKNPVTEQVVKSVGGALSNTNNLAVGAKDLVVGVPKLLTEASTGVKKFGEEVADKGLGQTLSDFGDRLDREIAEPVKKWASDYVELAKTDPGQAAMKAAESFNTLLTDHPVDIALLLEGGSQMIKSVKNKKRLAEAARGFEPPPPGSSTGGTTFNTVHAADNYIKAGDFPVSRVYADPLKKIYQPAYAKQVVSDGVTNFKRLGFDELASKYESMFGNFTNVTPEQVLTNGRNVVKEVGTSLVDEAVEAGGAIKNISSGNPSGIVQTAKELAERFPRAISNTKGAIEEAGIRAAKIRQSSPDVANAIKAGVDEKFISAVTEADEVTRQAYKKVIDIAEEPSKMGSKKQPSIVSGELAGEQFDLINKQKRSIGQKIGDTVKELSKNTKLNIDSSLKSIDDTLGGQGIGVKYTKGGSKLDFTGTGYTPTQRTKIEELYRLATEGGNNLTPAQIHSKDRLFSQLQRDANFEGVGDIRVSTPDGDVSLFKVFRDVFSKNLDEISPEMRALNKQYRDVSLIVDDLEDSIFKTPNFNVTKTADPAEFAKVNLRRIFGESQSSPAFEAVADKMDEFSRSLGYKNAKPKDIAAFAQELRTLYPETIPSAGFSGGIKLGVKDIVEKIANVGRLAPKDKQRALRQLIESLTKVK